jgi:hypothetical protein
MRSIHFAIFLVSALLAAGCSSTGWKSENIPLPRSTPFDSNQLARQAFLDGFERGYRSEKMGGPSSVELITGPFAEARRQGFNAGVLRARSDAGTPGPAR